jgi:hypothetical protein
MENPFKEGAMWPLCVGALTPKYLDRFRPLNYSVLAHAFEIGLVDHHTLADGFSKPGFAAAAPSKLLEIFLKTSSYIDRTRDIQEELCRLSAFDDKKRSALWMILARLILDNYPNPDEALRILQEVFQELGLPPAMRPFTLYGDADDSGSAASRSATALIARLDRFLTAHQT